HRQFGCLSDFAPRLLWLLELPLRRNLREPSQPADSGADGVEVPLARVLKQLAPLVNSIRVAGVGPPAVPHIPRECGAILLSVRADSDDRRSVLLRSGHHPLRDESFWII